VRKESARRIGLQAVRAPRQAIKGYQGEGLIMDSVYYLPLLDADGNIQVVRAHGVDEITTVTHTRLPHVAREIFPTIRAYMPWMETGAGRVELLIGLDNKQWLPAHVEDSWDPDDDMRLMKSAFGYRFMITDGWGRDLFPRRTHRVSQGAWQEVRPRPRKRPVESGWRNIEAGIEARGPLKRLTLGEPQEMGIEARVMGAEAERLPGERHPPEEDQIREEGREETTDPCAIRGCLPPRLGCRTLKASGECC
jgi:hypothetical protein